MCSSRGRSRGGLGRPSSRAAHCARHYEELAWVEELGYIPFGISLLQQTVEDSHPHSIIEIGILGVVEERRDRFAALRMERQPREEADQADADKQRPSPEMTADQRRPRLRELTLPSIVA